MLTYPSIQCANLLGLQPFQKDCGKVGLGNTGPKKGEEPGKWMVGGQCHVNAPKNTVPV